MSTKNKIQKYKFTFSIEENTKPLLGHKTGFRTKKKYFKKIQVTYKKSTVSSHMKSDEGEGETKKMKRRKNFQEVALSLTEPGHKVGGSQSSILSNVEKAKYGAAFPGLKPTSIQEVILPGVLPRSVPIKEVGFEEARDAMKANAEIMALKGKLDTEPTILLSAIATPAQFFLASAAATKYKKVPKGSSGATVNLRLGKKFTFTNRIDGWEKSIQEALKIDSAGDMKAALTAYTKINRQVTRDMINDFEKMTYDQKKLMNNVMNNLDRRCLVIKASLSTARPTSIASSTFSAGTMSTQLVTSANSAVPQAPSTADISFLELRDCLKHMQTIKLLASSRKISVTLVYGERRRRKCHRFEEKNKSNKVTYPKEKREFLQIMGLPEKMITTDGLDYNLKPEIDLQGLKIDYSPPTSRSNGEGKSIAENMKNDLKIMETMIDAVEKLTVCEEGSPSIAKNANSRMNPFKNTAVSPYPSRDRSSDRDSPDNKNSNGRKRLKKKILKRKKSPPPPDREDLRSMLSCDSCESSDCFESESEVSEDEYSVKDEYIHSANLQPEPFYGLDLTYVTFQMEKIGLVASKKLVSPFLRFTVRDIAGKLAEGTMVQETGVWDVINKNYLRAPGPIHLPLALEALPTDFGVFMELMHYRREHDCIATHCYAYLEREHLRTGEFLCELYRSPVDYSREKIRPYSDKAFFLHFTLAVNKG